MKKRIWTASVRFCGGVLMAQCKSSKAELKRRIENDDPVWKPPGTVYSMRPMFRNIAFKNGLAIIYLPKHHGEF
jgi:hypothetical protein